MKTTKDSLWLIQTYLRLFMSVLYLIKALQDLIITFETPLELFQIAYDFRDTFTFVYKILWDASRLQQAKIFYRVGVSLNAVLMSSNES